MEKKKIFCMELRSIESKPLKEIWTAFHQMLSIRFYVPTFQKRMAGGYHKL
jgi:hypothetical protein